MIWWPFRRRRSSHTRETLADGMVMFGTPPARAQQEQQQAEARLEELRRRLLKAETHMIREAHKDDQ